MSPAGCWIALGSTQGCLQAAAASANWPSESLLCFVLLVHTAGLPHRCPRLLHRHPDLLWREPGRSRQAPLHSQLAQCLLLVCSWLASQPLPGLRQSPASQQQRRRRSINWQPRRAAGKATSTRPPCRHRRSSLLNRAAIHGGAAVGERAAGCGGLDGGARQLLGGDCAAHVGRPGGSGGARQARVLFGPPACFSACACCSASCVRLPARPLLAAASSATHSSHTQAAQLPPPLPLISTAAARAADAGGIKRRCRLCWRGARPKATCTSQNTSWSCWCAGVCFCCSCRVSIAEASAGGLPLQA